MISPNYDPESVDALTELHVARSYLRDIKAKLDKAHHLVSAVSVAQAVDAITEAIQREQSTSAK